jgi:hypothetical protein
MLEKFSFRNIFKPLKILRTIGLLWIAGAACCADAQRVKITQTCANAYDCPLTLAEGFKTNLQFCLLVFSTYF